MQESYPARPGLAPGVLRDAGPMFAALYGTLTPHPWREPDSGNDAYSLFHQRSIAMGWLDDRSAGVLHADGTESAEGGAGLWGMNDAGWESTLVDPGAGLVSWFQVGASGVAGDRPLPVRPFLRCAEDATSRVGRLDLAAVQVLLPVQGLESSSRPAYAPVPSMLSVSWFAERDPGALTDVEVCLSTGRDPSAASAAAALVDELDALDQDVFTCRSFMLAREVAGLRAPFSDGLWNGPALHGLALRGELAEWTCDAVGWLAETLADCAARLGVRTPVLLTVVRR